MLTLANLHVSYGHIQALHGVSLTVPKGKIVSIIGSNGAGKTTMLNTICGLVKQRSGSIQFEGAELTRTTQHIIKQGLVHVPEGRKVFSGLTVAENLLAGGYILKDSQQIRRNMEKMFELYPILRERKDQHAGTLSGGEQQMLAICRGLMSEPKMILLDEPSLGLAPIIVNGVFQLIRQISEQGLTVMLVEQNAKKALALSDYAYVLENGKVVMQGEGKKLLCDEGVKKAYLGDR
ncbi:branched-chain amino acid transport system ATP-binding protein [Anaerospora hongkongensis]|uniref:Branched-chain amino acid transport system ATP-binding protein n=1 Tax=Anaerospora hongkongensis TaxID=244830 RepID=A0A4R1PW83_9FIRM|nr:ABC transporter ATP-binding protein [Anaerospora hongkongensis]TCL35167.1 branched-chain amino acid transport system ATP-binding protein [Anaerospora hongkongensis]